MSLLDSMTRTMTSKWRSSLTTTNAPPVEHGMQKWPSPHTAATNQPPEKEEENRWPMVNYTHKTCPSHPETNNNTKLSRNWGQPPATSLTMNKRRARLKGGTLSRFFWSKNFKIFTYWYTNNCQNENRLGCKIPQAETPSTGKSLSQNPSTGKSLPAKCLHRKIPPNKIPLGKMPTSKIPLKIKKPTHEL